MPSEVSDIKQFIEICRRKDAQCTCPLHPRRAKFEEEKDPGCQTGTCSESPAGSGTGARMDEGKIAMNGWD